MIRSAAEFVSLRSSDDLADQARATHDAADDAVWLSIIGAHPEMRTWVAHNKTVPMTIIKLLIEDSDPATRSWVARKRKLDRSMFVKLSADADEGVRFALANNTKLPPDLLRKLASDPVPLVADEATQRLVLRQARPERPKRRGNSKLAE
jgi:hypothetical protein